MDGGRRRSTSPLDRALREAGHTHGQQRSSKGRLATALVHDLIVATRDRAEFAKTDVEIVDPFTA
jgi:hypothetical protein